MRVGALSKHQTPSPNSGQAGFRPSLGIPLPPAGEGLRWLITLSALMPGHQGTAITGAQKFKQTTSTNSKVASHLKTMCNYTHSKRYFIV